MKNNISIKADIDKSKSNSSGECQIFIFLNSTVNSIRLRKKMFTGYSVKPDFWNNGKIKNINGADIVNLEIASMLAKFYKIKASLEIHNKTCKPDILLDIFKNENYELETSDYFSFVEKELKETRKDYSESHYKNLIWNLKNLKDFAGKNTLMFDEITPSFLNKYRYWMEHENGNKANTIYQRLSNIRKMMNVAIKQELTTNYAFKEYKIKLEQVEKDFLEIEEIKKLHSFYDSNDCSERLKVTLHYFLLSCYTGLRLSDIKRVNKESIINNTILLKTQKTGSHVRIPLNNSALRLLNFELEGIKLFERTIKQSNSRISKDINDALEIVGVKKKLTFHSSRHSFAINSLVLGIPIEVVSKILGHADLKTTQIYAKVVDSLTNREMEKWNNI